MHVAIPKFPSGVIDHDSELTVLRQALAALKDEARRNEEAWQRAQRHEMAVLEAATLGDLLVRLTEDLRATYRLAAATLVLVDPEQEVRQLLRGEGLTPADHPAVAFVDSPRALAPELERGPRLGPFSRTDHAVLFPANARVLSVALLPLLRGKCLIGSINMGSDRADRFTAAHATDFLSHLATIAAFGLESAVNRTRLVRSGLTDALTGWHNRRYLTSRLREELARCRRERHPLTCLMIDVDHFKRINDVYGHLAGDEVLRQVAQRIQRVVRDSDITARFGGEEFVILLPHTSEQPGGQLAERIRRAVADERFEIAGADESLSITVSIGVVEHRAGDATDDLDATGTRLLALSDTALYEAKAAGRNSVVHGVFA